MNRYPLNLFWSDADEGFIAEVPDLPGCSAWGDLISPVSQPALWRGMALGRHSRVLLAGIWRRGLCVHWNRRKWRWVPAFAGITS